MNWQHALCQPMYWQCDALYAVVVSCNSSMRPTAAVSSGAVFRAVLAVVFVRSVCRHSTLLSKAQSEGMYCQCLTALVTHSIFHQRWRHLNRGIALRISEPIMGNGHSCCNSFTAWIPSENAWHYLNEGQSPLMFISHLVCAVLHIQCAEYRRAVMKPLRVIHAQRSNLLNANVIDNRIAKHLFKKKKTSQCTSQFQYISFLIWKIKISILIESSYSFLHASRDLCHYPSEAVDLATRLITDHLYHFLKYIMGSVNTQHPCMILLFIALHQ